MPSIQQVNKRKTFKFKASKNITVFEVAQLLENIELRVDEVALRKLPPDVQKYFKESQE